MDLQPPDNLPLHTDPLAPPQPIQSMPTPPPGVADDMFSGVERSVASPVAPPMPMQPPMAPSQAAVPAPIQPQVTAPAAAPSRVLSGLPEAEHPPVLHYILIAIGVVVVLGLIAGGIWFFAIRRPARQVMEALPAATSSTETVDTTAAPIIPVDEPVSTTNEFDSPEVIPSKPVVTPPDGSNVPLPTAVDPNAGSSSSDPSADPAPAPAPAADQDGDGLTDAREAELGTMIATADTDGDALSDGDEVLLYRTNPLVPDTDGDGYPDNVEIQKGYNPLGAGQCANSTCTF